MRHFAAMKLLSRLILSALPIRRAAARPIERNLRRSGGEEPRSSSDIYEDCSLTWRSSDRGNDDRLRVIRAALSGRRQAALVGCSRS
ncbi:hypothetical protein C5688_00940 [Methylocystis sp. MitZ-2018]|nr:hypothetical protein C5688_00940 [Methylocystis sp. MitZ-2018]